MFVASTQARTTFLLMVWFSVFWSSWVRAVQSEKLLLTTLKIMPIPEAVAIPAFAQHLDEGGEFKANELVKDSARVMLDELARWSEALKPLRAA